MDESVKSQVPGDYVSRTPFDNVLNFVPQGHEKALKQAFYNTISILCVIGGCAAICAVYFVLEPFLKPLLWAVLCGCFLHPFKHKLTTLVRNWLINLREAGTPLTAGITLLPVSIVDNSAEALGDLVVQHLNVVTTVTVGLVSLYIITTFAPYSLLWTIGSVWSATWIFVNYLLAYFSSTWVWTLVAGYVAAVTFYWTPESSFVLRHLTVPVWGITLLKLAALTGALCVPLCIFTLGLIITGIAQEIMEFRNKYSSTTDNVDHETEERFQFTLAQAAWSIMTGTELKVAANMVNKNAILNRARFQSHINREDSSDSLAEDVPGTPLHDSVSAPAQLSIPSTPAANTPPSSAERVKSLPPILHQSSSPSVLNKSSSNNPSRKQSSGKKARARELSNMYLYGVLWACIVVQIWMHTWILPLIIFPAAYLLVKRAGSKFGVWQFVSEWLLSYLRRLEAWLGDRRDALVPPCVRTVGKFTLQGDQKILVILEQSLDAAMSIGVILMVLIFAVFCTIFFLIQIHGESMHLIQMGVNLVNSTVVHNPELQSLMPKEMGSVMDSMVDQAYTYGRQRTAQLVKSFLDEKDANRSAIIERQVLELWDKLYRSWTEPAPTTSQYYRGQLIKQNTTLKWTSMFEIFSERGAALFDFDFVFAFVKENIGTFMSVLESVWSVLKGNISLVFGALTAFASLLFGGGFALLNFVISFVVFVTALFYLLSGSGQQYKLVELFGKLSPGGSRSNGSTRLGEAVEEAVNGVFAASFKMAVFYGLWTYLIHTLFDVRIVFIPSVLAAMLGAVPFLGTYWASLPAILELWLVHDAGFMALLMFVCQILPMSCVDTAIYSQIKGGGHPYLTGLAIAGGIFCLGVEGALIGPMLLCCLFVATSMYGSLLRLSPDSDADTSIKRERIFSRFKSVRFSAV